jgi:hypothetical protein
MSSTSVQEPLDLLKSILHSFFGHTQTWEVDPEQVRHPCGHIQARLDAILFAQHLVSNQTIVSAWVEVGDDDRDWRQIRSPSGWVIGLYLKDVSSGLRHAGDARRSAYSWPEKTNKQGMLRQPNSQTRIQLTCNRVGDLAHQDWSFTTLLIAGVVLPVLFWDGHIAADLGAEQVESRDRRPIQGLRCVSGSQRRNKRHVATYRCAGLYRPLCWICMHAQLFDMMGDPYGPVSKVVHSSREGVSGASRYEGAIRTTFCSLTV